MDPTAIVVLAAGFIVAVLEVDEATQGDNRASFLLFWAAVACMLWGCILLALSAKVQALVLSNLC